MKKQLCDEQKMRYRLGIDLGTTSLGWAMLRLDKNNRPCAVIKAGVRIFSNGCDAKTGESLAVQRRLARQQRRTRDRTLRRKNRLITDLIHLGFFPEDEQERKELEKLNPYELRAKGINQKLAPYQFGRAIFHLAQRRGFKSNRKTDSGNSDSGKMKTAINQTREKLEKEGCQTIGQWLYKRLQAGLGTKAKIREVLLKTEEGKEKKSSIYDLYLDRNMVQDEFEKLWSSQASYDSSLFSQEAHDILKDTIFYQRDLKPVRPGPCTLMPENPRAPLALPSQQRFRIYQEVNNLRKLDSNLNSVELSLEERNKIVLLLEKNKTVSFERMKKEIDYEGDFNLEDDKRKFLKGNATTAELSHKNKFGELWVHFDEATQDQIVARIIEEQSEQKLCQWLTENFEISAEQAKQIVNADLPKGYGSLCLEALNRILPVLRKKVATYDKAVLEAGFASHSALSHLQETGELLNELPYYGEYLSRHVAFGSGEEQDPPEKRFGKIANPTVHIGLNQLRVVVNLLIRHYGKPSEIIIEVARDLKLSKAKKIEIAQEQAKNQKKRERIRKDIAKILGCDENVVSGRDITKWILWEELNRTDELERLCPYSGKQISATMLLNGEAEIEHILPFSRTLDDSMANKTISTREANRIKGNRTPWEAREDFERHGWSYDGILARAERMSKQKRSRFGETGYETWLKEDKDFVARALNDTKYMSVVAKEYLGLICPDTRSIPGRLTAMLRGKYGLNSILSDSNQKNRDDHRHHAIDACVIAVTDRSTLQQISTASARAQENGCGRILENLPPPWPSFRESVKKAIESIKVSHKPDHGYQGAMHDQTARGYLPNGLTITHKYEDGKRKPDIAKLQLIPITSPKASARHGVNPDGSQHAYKGYKGNSNFCIEIFVDANGKWQGNVISTFDAYQIVRKQGEKALRQPFTHDGKPLIMRLMVNDTIEINENGEKQVFLVNSMTQLGQIMLSPLNEANTSSRDRDKKNNFSFLRKRVGPLEKLKATLVFVSPIGKIRKTKP